METGDSNILAKRLPIQMTGWHLSCSHPAEEGYPSANTPIFARPWPPSGVTLIPRFRSAVTQLTGLQRWSQRLRLLQHMCRGKKEMPGGRGYTGDKKTTSCLRLYHRPTQATSNGLWSTKKKIARKQLGEIHFVAN